MTTEATEVAGQEAAQAAAAAAAATAGKPANPAAPAAPAAGAATTDAGDGIVPVEYAPIEDDPGLSMALQFIGKMGIGPDSPELQAALKGDFGFLEAKLASLGPKAQGWEQYLKLGKDSYNKHVESTAKSQEATRAAVEQVAGGPEQWKAVEDWARANADEAEKAELNKAFQSGGLQAKMAANYLCSLYAAASGTVVEPKNAAAPNVPANGGGFGAGAPMSPQQFQQAVAQLTKTKGMAAMNSPEYDALVARRQAFRG
jgi:hypothetical protein